MTRYSGRIRDVIPELLKMDMDKVYLVEVKEPKSKRSLEQNRMLWQLIHTIAKETHQDDMDVYCGALERADAKSEYIITAFDLENELRRHFRGVRFVRMQEVNGKECYIFKVYIGSSKMTTKEMTELLEITMQIASEFGIDTRGVFYE